MQLSIPKFFQKEKKEKNLFLALEITDEILKAAACEVENSKISILGSNFQEYDGSEEKAVLAADTVISSIEENLNGQSLEKVILGLPEDYIEEGKISPVYLVKIRALCEKLSLTPVGYVEIPLAITNYLKTENGSPESLVLVHLSKKLNVSLIRVGKLTNNITVERSENLALDLETAIKSFSGVEVLPSKIFLYSQKSFAYDTSILEAAKQELMSYPWTSRASFLHFPKIEIGQSDLDIKSIAFAGSAEMGKIETVETVKGSGEIEEYQEEAEKTTEPEPEIREGDNFGFTKEEAYEKPAENVLVTEEIKTEKEKFSGAKLTLPKFSFSKINLSGFSLPKFSFSYGSKSLIIIGGLGLLGVCLILGLTYWFYPQAKVSLILKPKTMAQPLEVTIDPDITEVSLEKNLLPGLNFETEKKSLQKTVTTGKKQVGEKAKGTVTIYNKTTNGKTFKKETILNGPNSLKFFLDNDVTVASISGDVTDPVSGRAEVGVTAVNLGTEGNLGAGQIFQFSDYPTDFYVAKNNSAFGGGTSRQISVVASSDREKLLSKVIALLTKQAKDDLLGKAGPQEELIEETIAGTVREKNFDKEVDEEATEINLTLKMNFQALGYKNSDLITFLEKSVGNSTPPNYELDKKSIKMDSLDLQKGKDGHYRLQADFKLSLLPKIDQKIIKQNLLGKNLTEVNNYLRQTANIAGYEIHFTRQLPFLNFMPHTLSNLAIETTFSK